MVTVADTLAIGHEAHIGDLYVPHAPLDSSRGPDRYSLDAVDPGIVFPDQELPAGLTLFVLSHEVNRGDNNPVDCVILADASGDGNNHVLMDRQKGLPEAHTSFVLSSLRLQLGLSAGMKIDEPDQYFRGGFVSNLNRRIADERNIRAAQEL